MSRSRWRLPRPRYRIRRLQTRILALFLLVLVVVQVVGFVLINTVGGASARKTITLEQHKILIARYHAGDTHAAAARAANCDPRTAGQSARR